MAKILFLTLFSFSSLLHPLHVSVTEIEHDEEEKRLEIVSRIFLDDLELAIRNNIGQPNMDILEPVEGYSTNQLIKDYFNKTFRLNVNGKQEDVEYLGYEIELPVIYIYAQVSKVRKLRDIMVHNSIIMDTHDDQTNLVHVEKSGQLKSLKLTNDEKADHLSFE